jgi:predicted hydrocarbon binding protein
MQRRPTDAETRGTERSSDARSVSPVFPLLLLETMRDRDRPTEVLEDEDISLSLPRRLGLSEVVRVQIGRFEEEVRQRRPQSAAQVEDLVRLVIRRPDAEEIFHEAGRRVARRFWSERSSGFRRMIRLLPRPLALIAAQRAANRMFGRLSGPTPLKFNRRPVLLRIERSLTARADPTCAACAFYSGALIQLLEQYTGRRYRVLHPDCGAGTNDGACEWRVEVAS